MRLFELPALEPDAKAAASHYQALGISAEFLLISRLLEIGHKVAVPVTDDDGVDIIVNYRQNVQVKSSSSRTSTGQLNLNLATMRASERRNGSQSGMWIRPHVDILAIYARDSRSWWFIPRDAVPAGTIRVCERGKQSTWHEAWHMFDVATTELIA